ncbi:MAG TPA: TIGR03619 family F420-dependent LLM class oxidoreductase [Solirubrobacteraceae bacterium]|nr:TIGR03619 family F420-dependent LLM class oxidoreductase [Solirubrobacteraceae bacterium]
MNTRFGLALENFTAAPKEPDVEELVAYARRAEELGFASLWAWDHMLLGTRSPFPFLESLTTLTALATQTSAVRLGTGVLVLPLRNPLVLAKVTASLDRVSGGRLTLGMAAGWYEREFAAAGVPFKARGRIFEHNLDVLERFWSGEPVAGEQDGIEYRNALMLPRPAQQPRPKVLIGGYVDKVLRRVATRSDGWLTYFYTAESFARAWAKVRAFAEEAGRDPDALENVAQLPICVASSFEEADRRARDYIATYFDLPEWSESSAESSIRGTPEQCAEQLNEQFEAGVQHVCLCPAGYDREQVERIAAEVLPLLEGAGVEAA